MGGNVWERRCALRAPLRRVSALLRTAISTSKSLVRVLVVWWNLCWYHDGRLDSLVRRRVTRKLFFVPSGGEVRPKGGDPRTGLFVPSGGEVKTDQFVPSGGEVKTDHNPFDVQMACLVDETVDSPLPGGLATQTAIPDPVSPALVLISRFSRLDQNFVMNSRVLSRIQNFAMDCRAVSRIQKFATSSRVLEICRVKHILKG